MHLLVIDAIRYVISTIHDMIRFRCRPGPGIGPPAALRFASPAPEPLRGGNAPRFPPQLRTQPTPEDPVADFGANRSERRRSAAEGKRKRKGPPGGGKGLRRCLRPCETVERQRHVPRAAGGRTSVVRRPLLDTIPTGWIHTTLILFIHARRHPPPMEIIRSNATTFSVIAAAFSQAAFAPSLPDGRMPAARSLFSIE